jgi:hypothetical protein
MKAATKHAKLAGYSHRNTPLFAARKIHGSDKRTGRFAFHSGTDNANKVHTEFIVQRDAQIGE